MRTLGHRKSLYICDDRAFYSLPKPSFPSGFGMVTTKLKAVRMTTTTEWIYMELVDGEDIHGGGIYSSE